MSPFFAGDQFGTDSLVCAHHASACDFEHNSRPSLFRGLYEPHNRLSGEIYDHDGA